jgi:phthiocerol/phenolphthiocerol synthesis type-I polyketide synthase E
MIEGNLGHSGDLTNAVAVIGMAGRFPDADNVAALWRNIVTGCEAIRTYTDQELREVLPERLLRDPNLVPVGSVLNNFDMFDAEYFRYSPREAETIDPQQRMFLECAVEALEDSGCRWSVYAGDIGIFGGASLSSYLRNSYESLADDLDGSSVLPLMLLHGNDKDYLTTRVSYKLNLRGPSFALQTACSTSLVAVHVACQSLLAGECDMALAGGVSVRNSYWRGYVYTEGGMLSPDGHCRPFDSRAQGTVFGDGVGIVVLKRLDQALRDGDNVRAVIRGSAINNDGSAKVGFTAPSIGAQAEVVEQALSVAGLSPADITYIEAHGTGTELGDPIEVAGLTEAFRRHTPGKGFCCLGSVKANVGHLDCAAGVTGLIKGVLALENRTLPPLINFRAPNPSIDLANSPFYINTEARPWTSTGKRRAGVSAFGVGGTNAHVILEEAPAREVCPSRRARHPLLLSARSGMSLDTLCGTTAEWLQTSTDEFADIAFTLCEGRVAHRHVRAFTCRDAADALELLRGPGRLNSGERPETPPAVYYLFPGQGAQRPNMGRSAYEQEPVYRDAVELCASILSVHTGIDLRDVLYPTGSEATAVERLTDTQYAQPAIFVTSWALTQLFKAWGVTPKAMLGHSVGEFVAACVSGVFSLEDALKIISVRAAAMQEMPRGSMVSVMAGAEEVGPHLTEEVSIASANASDACVISGPSDSVERIVASLEEQGLVTSPLRVSHAFHSSMMTPAAHKLATALRQIQLNRPTIPFVSNVTGTWITDEQAMDPDYWSRQLLETVQFAAGVETLVAEPGILFEVGPGRSLSGLAMRGAADRNGVVAISTMPLAKGGDEGSALVEAACQLWIAGVEVDWAALYAGEARRRVSLPARPFERKRYWLPGQSRREVDASKSSPTGMFWAPTWKRLPVAAPREVVTPAQRWLLLSDGGSLSAAIEQILTEQGAYVNVVRDSSDLLGPETGRHYVPYVQLQEELKQLDSTGKFPDYILYLWSLPAGARGDDDADLERTFYRQVELLRSLDNARPGASFRMGVVTCCAFDILGNERVSAMAATAVGPSLSVPIENPAASSCVIDVTPRDLGSDRVVETAQTIIELVLATQVAPRVGLRNGYRWFPVEEPLTLSSEACSGPSVFESDGVFLITGGTGGIGLEIAAAISKEVSATFLLTGRTKLPERDTWDKLCGAASENDRIATAIRKIKEIEARGSTVVTAAANVASLDEMKAALALVGGTSKITSVFHAAGVGALDLTVAKARAHMEDVLAPKIAGTLALAKLFDGTPLQQFVLFSSISALRGYLGHADYSAANAFLDAFGPASRHLGGHVVAINWDAWSDAGMLARSSAEGTARGVDNALTTAEAIEALKQILRSGLPHVLVAKPSSRYRDDMAPRLAPAPAESVEQVESNRSGVHPRPTLSTPFVLPRSDIETLVADMWAEALSFEAVGIDDDFFALGGHSLMALKLLKRLRDLLAVKLVARDLFASPTVRALAEAIERQLERPLENAS